MTATLTDTIQEGYEYLFEVGTEKDHPAFDNILGISMTLEISVAANVPDSVTIQDPVIFYDQSVMGTKGLDMMTLDSLQLLEHNLYEWDIALVKTNHQGVSEGGNLCVIACIFSVGSIGKNGAQQVPVTVRLKNIQVINDQEGIVSLQSFPVQRFTIGEEEDDLPTNIVRTPTPILQFYPNPTRDWLRIHPPMDFSNELIVKLLDKNGALVLEQSILEVNVRSLHRGLYWLVLEDRKSGKVAKVEKVLVQ